MSKIQITDDAHAAALLDAVSAYCGQRFMLTGKEIPANIQRAAEMVQRRTQSLKVRKANDKANRSPRYDAARKEMMK